MFLAQLDCSEGEKKKKEKKVNGIGKEGDKEKSFLLRAVLLS